MLVLALDTLVRALRAPGVWVLFGLGLATGWAGLSLAVLALGDTAHQAPEMISSTTQTWAGLLTIWTLARFLDQDRGSDLRAALDASRVGEVGRGLGRWAGAVLLGASGATVLGGVLALQVRHGVDTLSLLYTSISVALAMGAWALALTAWLGPGLAMGGSLFLWVLGHLPWGSDALVPGFLGHAVLTVLPRPMTLPATMGGLASTGCLVLGLLLMAAVPVKTGSMLRSPGGGRSVAMG